MLCSLTHLADQLSELSLVCVCFVSFIYIFLFLSVWFSFISRNWVLLKNKSANYCLLKNKYQKLPKMIRNLFGFLFGLFVWFAAVSKKRCFDTKNKNHKGDFHWFPEDGFTLTSDTEPGVMVGGLKRAPSGLWKKDENLLSLFRPPLRPVHCSCLPFLFAISSMYIVLLLFYLKTTFFYLSLE
jgi:hypothetical protein